MFESVTPVAPDPIFGLTEAFRADASPRKVNLGVGVYQDEAGQTPILAAVKTAEALLLERETDKVYLPMDGPVDYIEAVQHLLLGSDHPRLGEQQVVTVQAPGGTGALRVAGDFVKSLHPEATVWIGRPTWANHDTVFQAVGLQRADYPYFDVEANHLEFDGMLTALEQARPGDVVLLHACCHNPSGVDLDAEQWQRVAEFLVERQLLPLLDFAYQGFLHGTREDAESLRILASVVPELMVCNSFSKNFGLYNERVGGLTVIAPSADSAKAVRSRVKRVIRANYSNPASHGACVVSMILHDRDLEAQWREELRAMRQRIHDTRAEFATALDQRGVRLSAQGNDFIMQQHGMFSFCRLSREQVLRLREEYAIYMVESGRINVAGINPSNLDYLCDAIASQF